MLAYTSSVAAPESSAPGSDDDVLGVHLCPNFVRSASCCVICVEPLSSSALSHEVGLCRRRQLAPVVVGRPSRAARRFPAFPPCSSRRGLRCHFGCVIVCFLFRLWMIAFVLSCRWRARLRAGRLLQCPPNQDLFSCCQLKVSLCTLIVVVLSWFRGCVKCFAFRPTQLMYLNCFQRALWSSVSIFRLFCAAVSLLLHAKHSLILPGST